MSKRKFAVSAGAELTWAIIFSLGWLVCAMIALELTQGADGLAAVWPSSGIFVAALLLLNPRGRKLTSIGVALASFVANMWSGVGVLPSVGYTIANLIEGWLVFALMGGGRTGHVLLARPLNLLRFAASALIGGVASAIMAGILSSNFDTVFLTSWMSTVTLGMLVVTPVVMFLHQDKAHETRMLSLRGFWTFVFVALTALAAFGQAAFPLLILPLVAISITTAALGLSGAMVALLLVTAIGSVLTIFDLGPVGTFFPPVEQQVLVFQVYLLALLVSTLPVALSLARNRRDLEEIATSKRLLEAAERAAKVGHWRHDPDTDAIYWSEEAGRMLAREPLPATLTEMAEMFHEHDRPRVMGLLAGRATPAFHSYSKPASTHPMARRAISNAATRWKPSLVMDPRLSSAPSWM
ncbi:MASE1 domain-containing protein [Qipengyuania sp. SS22]|uniref:MASE1 domain-containing protein n=1 Tax=Qipengyuania sp. SS22 TaxID=2979461 RepID=UPI0021E625DD|nr:MASE1 domain-containing protein [Qipengyuania sp. SS22]UYH55450.1 MASE1 domain-containing protein [Qipengyuania sp. SS22]